MEELSEWLSRGWSGCWGARRSNVHPATHIVCNKQHCPWIVELASRRLATEANKNACPLATVARFVLSYILHRTNRNVIFLPKILKSEGMW
jgi:hypothetical protein